ncbi:MAG: TerB family tellurite resistance protein [Bacteroidetes bacterium]|nr:TerB family tellurite resistance protein [Bacteroidota bacterium]
MSSFIVIIIAIIFIYALFSVLGKKGKPASPKPGSDPNQDYSKGSSSRSTAGSSFGTGSGLKYGKWVGGGLGWVFGGPIGAILGFAMGSMLDGVRISSNVYKGTARDDFAMSLLVLSAAVMKADGKVVKSELDYVKNFFLAQFGVDETERLLPILREILKQDINVPDVSIQIGQYMDYSSRLQLMHYLFGIAQADGQIDVSEVDIIERISASMGIHPAEFASIKAMFIKDLNNAYSILEIIPDATDDEVKKAYRRLAVQYHPDKVAHLGEDIKKSATEKFQKLNAAYEEIKKQRGIK